LFLGFRLVEELGQGAFARVYLAEQAILANRQVALKITLRPNSEPERLARLQHTNIVPVYSVHNAPPVQVICMPYLGRRTIADLIRNARRGPQSRKSGGRRTWGTRKAGSTTLRSTHTPLATAKQPTSDLRVPVTAELGPVPHILGDVRGVLELLVQLADGLAHAHDRGILHLDLKPANILLADTGEPMLLDFNLSFDTTRRDRDLVGGTVSYMAPEQLIDMRTRGKGTVDARTDLYGLGIVAYEMLTGSVPFRTGAADLANFDRLIATRNNGPPPLRTRIPDVTPAVEAIIRKLLAPEPTDRYQSATQLRTDLQRHLNDQPLKFAREASVRERFGKWRRRNPQLLGRLVLAAVCGLAVGLGVVARNEATGRAAAHAEAVAKDQAEQTRQWLDTLRLDLIAAEDGSYRPRGLKRAGALLASYGLPHDPDWRKRPLFAALPAEQRLVLAADLGELLLLVTQARWHDAQRRPDHERKTIATELLVLNRAARGCFTTGVPPPMLIRQSNELRQATGEDGQPDNVPEPATARDHFLDAVTQMAAGRYAAAIPVLDEALGKQPDHGAANFYRGYCLQQRGEYQRASERYEMAQKLLPTDPRPFYQRGVMFGLQQNPQQAEPEFTRAIDLDANFAEGYRNRAIARMRLEGKEKEAEADLTAALDRGGRPLMILPLRAEVREKLGDREGAAIDRAAVQGQEPQTEAEFIVRGVARAKADPRGALVDFRAAAEVNSGSLVALRNQAHVLAAHLHDLDGALEAMTRAVGLYPESAIAHADRAVLLARLGRRAEAHKASEAALVRSNDPQIAYKLACVYALTSATNPEDRPKALEHLRRAFRGQYPVLVVGRDDRDLDPIRDWREFNQLWDAMRKVAR
jgi:serine/threonine protein kinase/tetratricopeptide (TPR) repeat protein